jgi:hypothetical protein
LLEILNDDFEWSDVIIGMISTVNTDTNKYLQKIALLLPDHVYLEFKREDIVKRNFEKISPYL